MRKFLVIAPHHDDEVLGCGGGVIKLVDKGYLGAIVYITAGWSGIPQIRSKRQAQALREKEAVKACKILGVKDQYFLGCEDRNFEVSSKLIKRLVKIIRKVQPDLIFAPHGEESDSEHKKTYQVFKEALWISKSSYFPDLGKPASNIKAVFLYEVWTPMKKFLVKEDISDILSQKRAAMAEYKSQGNTLMDAMEGLNLYRGSMTSSAKRYSEVYQIENLEGIDALC